MTNIEEEKSFAEAMEREEREAEADSNFEDWQMSEWDRLDEEALNALGAGED